MSSGKRKLSFLGFAPQAAGEDELQLDEEMERVVWGDTPARFPANTAAEPRRDDAAPPPYSQTLDGGVVISGGVSAASPATQLPSAAGSEPQISGALSGSASGVSASSARDDPRHVQFDGDNAADAEPLDDADDERRSQRNARHLHPHKSRKYSLQEGARGGGPGAELERRVSVEPGDEPLREADAAEMYSHRSDDPRALRRHRIQPRGSTVHVGRKDGGDKVQNILSDTTYKKMYDHSPHSVFVQLDELLVTDDGESEWKETARWIKYEEDVEEGSARWGKPHVASLSFHSLLNLRRCLETGVVLLDLDEKDLPGVAYRVVERMVTDGLIEEDDKPVVMRSLLLRHRHVHDDRFRFSISARKHSSYTSLQSLWQEEGGLASARARCSVCSTTAACRRHSAHLIVRTEPVMRVCPLLTPHAFLTPTAAVPRRRH